MKIFLKSSLRQPLKTIISILIIALVSFAFFSKAMEYLAVQKNIDNLSSNFKAIGRIQTTEKNNWDVSEALNTIEKSKLVEYVDVRRTKYATAMDVYSPDTDGSCNKNIGEDESYILGTILQKESCPTISYDVEQTSSHTVSIKVEMTLAGMPEFIKESATLKLFLSGKNSKDEKRIYDELKKGETYLLCVKSIMPPSGNSYLYNLLPLDSKDRYSYPAANTKQNDVSNPKLEEIKERIQIAEENAHNLNITGTKDMNTMPWSTENFFVKEGRYLTYKDWEKKNNVCVIRWEFAKKRKLEVGDTLKIKAYDISPNLVNVKQYGDGLNWENAFEKEYKIVGLYGSTDSTENGLNLYYTNVYIPDSCIPLAWKADFVTTRSSNFLLKSPDGTKEFLEKYEEILAKKDYFVEFYDSGWDNFKKAIVPILDAARFGTLIFTGVLLLVSEFIIFLYIQRKKKEFAILRAIGESRANAACQLILPLAIMGAFGILSGCITAWYYTIPKVTDMMSRFEIESGQTITVMIPVMKIIPILLLMLFLFLTLVTIGAWKVSKKPVLIQIQGGNRK